MSGNLFSQFKGGPGRAENTRNFVSQENPLPVTNYWLEHAIQIIYADYGDIVSISDKHKDLLKFGRSEQVQTGTKVTLMTLPSGTYNETYVATNSIDTISSSSTADTGDIVVEGHTVDGNGNFTFVTQTPVLDGRNKVVLATPLARGARIKNGGSTDFIGDIYLYEDGTISLGVPSDPTTVHCEIRAGENNSEKCATTASASDYWIVTGWYADVLEKTAATAEVIFEVREKGKVFIEKTELSCSNTAGAYRPLEPHIIVPKNADVRLRAIASANGTIVSGGIVGVLAAVVTN